MKNVHFQCIRKKSALKTTKRPQTVFCHVLPATKPSELRRHLAITTVLTCSLLATSGFPVSISTGGQGKSTMENETSAGIVPQIQWFDGMALLPHHFQQMELRWSQVLAYHMRLASSYHWGVQGIVFDEVCLPDGLLRLLKADLVMPDGYIFHYFYNNARDGTDAQKTLPPVELDLTSYKPASSREEILVQISLPARVEGMSPLHGASPRFRMSEGVVAVDENTDDTPVEIPRLVPCFQLSVGEHLPPHHVGFPLAKFAFVDGSFQRREYTPPCFFIEPNSPLWARCRQTVRRIREKALALSEKWQNQVGTSLLRETADMLRPLVTVLPPLETLMGELKAHPLDVTQTFLDAAGVIAQLDLANVPPRFPAYRHNSIDAGLIPILAYIEQSLDRLSTEYAIFPFKKNGQVFSFKLNKVICADLNELFVGLRAKPGIQAPQIENWMRDAIIVSDDALQKVQSKRIIGAPRHLLEGDKLYEMSPPRDMTLFSVEVDQQFIFPGQYLHIFNPSDTEYERPAEIMLYVHKIESVTLDEAA